MLRSWLKKVKRNLFGTTPPQPITGRMRPTLELLEDRRCMSVSFAPAVAYPVDGSYGQGIASGDLNGDDKADIAVANWDTGTVSVLLNNGNGTFAAPVNYSVISGPVFVVMADLDGDGLRDLAVGGGGGVSILRNTGGGVFAPAGTLPGRVYSLAVGDLDSDGDVDLATAIEGHTSPDGVVVFLNHGNGSFAAGINYETGLDRRGLAIADLDGDGHLDIAVTNHGSQTVSLLFNTGNGSFSPAINYSAGNAPIALVLQDLNNDGNVDVAVTNRYSSQISVLLNNGDGTYSNPVAYNVGTATERPLFMTSGDFDLDGDFDLAISAPDDYSAVGHVYVLLNNGAGAFNEATTLDMFPPGGITTADLNGDGQPDLAVGGLAPFAAIFLNTSIQEVIDIKPGSDLNPDNLADTNLENRALMSTVTWDGGGGDYNWHNALNWSGDQLPGVNDKVVIDYGANEFTVNYVSGADSIQSLDSKAAIAISGGSLSVSAHSTINNTLSISGATLILGSSLNVTGLVSLYHATLSAGGGLATLTANGGINEGSIPHSDYLDGITLINSAGQTFNLVGNLRLDNGAAVFNYGTVVFNDGPNNASIRGDATGAFYNYGTIIKSGTGAFAISIPFTNPGTVEVEGGTLVFEGGGRSSGNMKVTKGANLSFSASPFSLVSTSLLQGKGVYSFNTGPVILAGTFADGTLTSVGELKVPGVFTWAGGTIKNSHLCVEPGGAMTISGAYTKILDGTVICNEGLVTWEGAGNIVGINGSVVDNRVGGTFEVRNDQIFDYGNIGGVPGFLNRGLFQKTAGTGTTTFTILFSQKGEVKVLSGTVVGIQSGATAASETQQVQASSSFPLPQLEQAIEAVYVRGEGTEGTLNLFVATYFFAGSEEFFQGLISPSYILYDLRAFRTLSDGEIQPAAPQDQVTATFLGDGKGTLAYFDGAIFRPVFSSQKVADSYVVNPDWGTIQVVFDDTSTPKVTELNGTIFTTSLGHLFPPPNTSPPAPPNTSPPAPPNPPVNPDPPVRPRPPGSNPEPINPNPEDKPSSIRTISLAILDGVQTLTSFNEGGFHRQGRMMGLLAPPPMSRNLTTSESPAALLNNSPVENTRELLGSSSTFAAPEGESWVSGLQQFFMELFQGNTKESAHSPPRPPRKVPRGVPQAATVPMPGPGPDPDSNPQGPRDQEEMSEMSFASFLAPVEAWLPETLIDREKGDDMEWEKILSLVALGNLVHGKQRNEKSKSRIPA